MTTDRGDSFASQLASGASVGNGRYQLLTPHGGRTHLQFWRGFDVVSGQDVALTLVDPDCKLPEEFVHEILARTVRLKGIDMPGVAGVLAVFHTGRFGVVVSEWIHGGGVRQIAATAPSPTRVTGAMQALGGGGGGGPPAAYGLAPPDTLRWPFPPPCPTPPSPPTCVGSAAQCARC